MKIVLIFLLIIPQLILAQNDNLWRDVSLTQARISDNWKGINLNRKELNHEVLDVILNDVRQNRAASIAIPHPSGGELIFNIQPSSLLAKGLQEKYPEIQTFKGFGENGEVIYMDVNPNELHAMIFTTNAEGIIYVDPESSDSFQYVSYFKSDYLMAHSGEVTFMEDPVDHVSVHELRARSQRTRFNKRTIGSQMRKYRIAVAAASDYTAFHGGTVSGALQAIVTTLNRVTGIYENMGITFELVSDNDKLIYTSSSQDPYTSNSTSTLRAVNQENTDNIIGFDNYDIGHLFKGLQGPGGQASFGQVCLNRKASAVTSRGRPRGDSFDVSFVAHEIGHQFGAFHTFTALKCFEGATNFQERGAYEIGSGSTIMSYASLCGYNNIKPRPDDYFHAVSTENMLRYVIDGGGRCANLIETGNTPPTVSIREGGFNIPINTPFVLEAEGDDVDGDLLTYNWEQFDHARKMENMIGTPLFLGRVYTREELEAEGLPESQIETLLRTQEVELAAMFEGDGPLFRSFPPTSSNKRYFPKLSDVLAGDTSITEVLPFKNRELNFVITVWDNNPNGGGLTNDLLSFSSTDQAGPFVVTSSFSEPEYAGFSNLTVEWDVANTNVAPVNCQKVNILYSANGGENFDIILTEATENDGSETIKLPNIGTAEARIMVKAADNVFFNVNNANFTVVPSEVDIPEASSELVGTKTNDRTIALSWTDNSEVEDGFIIERRSGSGQGFLEIARTVLDKTSYIDKTIDAAESYAYRVAAFNATGVAPYTNIVSFEADVLSASDANEATFLYPNPVGDEIHLPAALSQRVSSITVFDLRGKRIIDQERINTPIEKVNVADLRKGLYIISITTSDGEIMRKFYKE